MNNVYREKQKECQMIGFVGYESKDIVWYTAKLLSAYGKKVLIEDRTEYGIMLRMLEKGHRLHDCFEEREMIYENIVITDALDYREEYDVVLVSFGYRIYHPKLIRCHKVVFVSDGLPAHAALLSEICAGDRRQCLVIRNNVAGRYAKRYLPMLVKQRAEQIWYLPYNEKDTGFRYRIGTSKVRLCRLSSDMKCFIRELFFFCCEDASEKKVKQAWRDCNKS